MMSTSLFLYLLDTALIAFVPSPRKGPDFAALLELMWSSLRICDNVSYRRSNVLGIVSPKTASVSRNADDYWRILSSTKPPALSIVQTLGLKTSFQIIGDLVDTLSRLVSPKTIQNAMSCVIDVQESLLSPSRKSFITPLEVEVHTVAQGLLWPGRTQGEYEATVYQILPYTLNSEVSFIALRYLARTLSSPQANIFAYTYYSPKFTEKLARYLDVAPKRFNLEWENLDTIVSQVFADDYWCFGLITRPELVDRIWSKVVERVLRASYFPETITHLVKQTDFELNVASGDLRSLAIYPILILKSAESRRALPFDVCQFLSGIPAIFEHPALLGLRKNLELGPNLLLSAILRERVSSVQGSAYHEIDSVADGTLLRKYCQILTAYALSNDGFLFSRGLHHMKIVASLDRYCFRTISESQTSLSKNFTNQKFVLVKDILREAAQEQSLSSSRERSVTRVWAYRHRSTDTGKMHIRHGLAFSRLYPCETCVALGIWNDWINSLDASCEALVAEDDQFLWLYVDPSSPFDAAGHKPILAGVNDLGETEYIASAGVEHANYVFPAFFSAASCTITQGARTAVFEYAGHITSTPYFRVLVLRYNTDAVESDPEGLESAIAPYSGFEEHCSPGTDATGPVYWREVWTDDDDERWK
ncbi:hypothetical protein DFH11DRAFT_1077180 [Phellopilus nigrolimitatus]|nr:hypothetical protein DFH11DRAFT_1077180 [Phellopilus nigrolimitatus]